MANGKSTPFPTETIFQKIYDLAENVIPSEDLSELVDEGAFVDWACRSALKRLGFATSGEIAAFWDIVTPAEASAWCENALGAGAVERGLGRELWRPAAHEVICVS